MADTTDPDWASLAPELREREAFLQDLARQVRIRLHARRTETEVSDWLQELGMSTAAATFFLTTCPRTATPAQWAAAVMTGPFDVGRLLRRSSDDADVRCRERRERRRTSRHLAATEPDPAFVFPGDSYAQVLARETRRGWGWVVIVVVAVLVFLTLGLGLLSLLFG